MSCVRRKTLDRHLLPLILGFCSLLQAGCSDRAVVADSALVETRSARGDTVVVTHVRGQQWKTDRVLGEELRIGRDDGPEEYTFGRIIAIAAKGKGPVYVYDDQFHQFRMYDVNGRFIRHIGRKGRGPGEYQYIIGLSVMQDGRIAAWDARSIRINLYDAGGKSLRDLQLRLGGSLFTDNVFATDTANTFYVLTLSLGRLRMLHADATGTVVDTIRFPRGQPFQGMDGVHARLESAFHHHGYYVWGISDRYVIHGRHPDGRPLQIQRSETAVAFSSAERSQVQAALDSSLRREREDERPRGEYGVVPSVKPFFTNIRVAGDGSIWVSRIAPSPQFDVFAADGAFLGSVPIPPGVDIELIDGEYLWGTARDADGVMSVVRYRLVEKHD